MNVVWEDPPPVPPKGVRRAPSEIRHYGPAFVELTLHPKRWGRIAEFDFRPGAWNAATSLRRQYGDGFEYAPRSVGSGSALYVRFRGTAEAS